MALILGIASIPLTAAPPGHPGRHRALVTGYLGQQKAAQGQANNAGQAKAGLICGAVGVGLGIIRSSWHCANVNLPAQP